MNDPELISVYYDPSHWASFGGPAKLKKVFPKKSMKAIMLFLRNQKTYTTHKKKTDKFIRRKINVPTINYLWQADLIVMEKYGRVNKGFKYILTMIDCLSRYAYVRPLKTKSAQEVLSALKIFINQNLHPKMLQTDQGKEFFNAPVKKFLSLFGICHFHNFSEKKACVIERFNRTLMMKLSKIFSLRKSFRYYDVLDKVVKAYNNTVHSATKQCPVNVDEYNQFDVWIESNKELLSRKTENKKATLAKNSHVRVRRLKKQFEKGYSSNYTEEIFKVRKVVQSNPVTYKLSTLEGDYIDGSFYKQELSEVSKSQTTVND